MILSRENWINRFLLLGSILCSVYLAELLLFFFADELSYRVSLLTGQGTRLQTARAHGETVDSRGVLQIAQDLTTQQRQVVIRMSPTFIANNSGAMFALAGMSNTLTVHCNEFGSPVIYHSDEHGFRNPPGLYRKDAVDIVLLGDSFTHGSCVPEGKEVASLLRKYSYRALNLGYSSNGPLIELATLREYSRPLAPRIVLWLYYEGNDLKNLNHSVKEYKELLAYLTPDYSRHLIRRQPEIDKKLALLYHTFSQKHVYRWQKPTLAMSLAKITRLQHLRTLGAKVRRNFKKKRLGPLNNFRSNPPETLFRQILGAAKQEITAWGGQMYFVYLPTWTRYTDDFSHKNLAYRDDVLELVKRLRIPIIDFHSELNRQADPLSFFPYGHLGHYTSAGHELLAKLIQSTIDKQ